ncbi:hypothetical protein AADX85_14855, partial [Staphylococcus epidermidis]
PTDGAFITAYQKAFGVTEELEELDLMPFDSDFRYMAKLVRLADGTKKLYIKGSPDKLLPRAKQADPNFDEAHYLAWTSACSQKGQR